MPQAASNQSRRASPGERRFALYVEGPRDHEIVLAWAKSCSRTLARILADTAVILGGRQPARAAGHFRRRRRLQPDASGLCVLDRDAEEPREENVEPGLEFFTWSRRHIESYLLVGEAIRRSLRLPEDDRRIESALRRRIPDPEDEEALRSIDAKRLLARNGELATDLGVPIVPGRIARAMRVTEFHPDVQQLLSGLLETLGIEERPPRVIVRNGGFGRNGGKEGILSSGG